MKEDTEITYNGYRIYLNKWGEHCVCHMSGDQMVSWNAGFSTLEAAKNLINSMNSKKRELSQEEIERLAAKYK